MHTPRHDLGDRFLWLYFKDSQAWDTWCHHSPLGETAGPLDHQLSIGQRGGSCAELGHGDILSCSGGDLRRSSADAYQIDCTEKFAIRPDTNALVDDCATLAG